MEDDENKSNNEDLAQLNLSNEEEITTTVVDDVQPEVDDVQPEVDDVQLENNPFANVKIERRSSATAAKENEKIESEKQAEEEAVSVVVLDVEEVHVRKVLNSDDINPAIKALNDNSRNPMEARATELEETLNDNDEYEFVQVLRANKNDAHAFGQPQISFLRKVLAIVCYPKLLEDSTFPEDVKSRARAILDECKGNSISSVTDPAGIEGIRKHVAKYIENRDSYNSKWQNVILTAGSSAAIEGILKLIACDVDGKKAGVMLPVPTKLIYQSFVESQDMQPIGYYLNEENNWSIDIDELNRAYDEASSSCNPRAIIVINPGQPTGNVLTRENIEVIIKFAYEKQLLICADEVHQFDILSEDVEFVSFKKVLKELDRPYSKMELASVMSASGGFLGEGSLRGGCVEFINVEPDVKGLYMKYISTQKCPPVFGQVAIEVLVNPPLPEEPSYNEYMNEIASIIDLHRVQAGMVTVAFNNFTNFSCSPILAGRHAFPRVNLPAAAIKSAEEAKQAPDLYYTLQLLEQKGICVSPGCQFGQKENTFHICIALVLPPDDLNLMLGKFKQFNQRFNETFSCKCKRKNSVS